MLRHPVAEGATGLAFYGHPFAEGVERQVYRCTEINVSADSRAANYRLYGHIKVATRLPRRLVSKEAKHDSNLGRKFQQQHAQVQTEAEEVASVFRRRVQSVMGVDSAEHQLRFLGVDIYCCMDERYPNGEAWVLVEDELEGRFRKWNSNNGAVYTPRVTVVAAAASRPGGGAAVASLGAICEDGDEEEGWGSEDEGDGFGGESLANTVGVDEVPQAFSHFSYDHSGGKTLVCDLQGVWNAVDGFVLTDPVIHYVSSRAVS